MAGTHAGPLDLDLAAMEADLRPWSCPSGVVPSVSAAVAGTAHPGRILLSMLAKFARPVVRQKRFEARSNLLPGIFDDCRRDNIEMW